jgi:hypothetical protein
MSTQHSHKGCLWAFTQKQKGSESRQLPARVQGTKSPHARLRSGAGQGGAFTGGVTTRRMRVTIVHAGTLSIS